MITNKVMVKAPSKHQSTIPTESMTQGNNLEVNHLKEVLEKHYKE